MEQPQEHLTGSDADRALRAASTSQAVSGNGIASTGQERPRQERFSFVAVRHRPLREIVGIAEEPHGTFLTYSCGHVAQHAWHFTYSLGERSPCMECGIAIASELPEFKGWFDASGEPTTHS